MKNIITFVMGLVILLVVSCVQKIDIEAEKTSVKSVLDQFIQASETGDMELLSKVYAHDSDMVIFGTHANERIEGWDNLKKLMQQQFDSTGSSMYAVKNQVIKVHESGKAAWFSEIIDWELEYQGELVSMAGLRVTGVLEKRNGAWVIVQLHYSVPADDQATQQ